MPIREDQQANWDRFVEINSHDPYSKCCVTVTRKVVELLDNLPADAVVNADQLITQADRELNTGITGFMAACVANAISSAHTRGEEFRTSWNKEGGGSQAEKANSKPGAVINPAVLSIGTGDD